MRQFLESLRVPELKFTDALDILIVWFIFYSLLRFIKGSRSRQMVFGLLALFVIQILAESFNLLALSALIGSLFNIIPIAIIVLFQDEIRRVLASLGTNPFNSAVGARSSVLDSIFRAAIKLSEKEVGSLIVFEGQHGLKNYIDSGTRLDAMPSGELLVDIFQNKSNLHDGAVIISESRVASAACLLPLSSNPHLPKSFGTRHRAAIGITEETDCVSLVVSEETGNISFTKDGEIYPVPEKNISKLYETYNALTSEDAGNAKDLLKPFSKGFFSRWRFNGEQPPAPTADPANRTPKTGKEKSKEPEREEVLP